MTAVDVAMTAMDRQPDPSSAQPGVQAPLAATAADQLIRFAQHHGEPRCHLLLDPVLRDARHALQAAVDALGGTLEVTPVGIAPARLDRKHWPVLCTLNLGDFSGSELVAISMTMALDDWQPVSRRMGNGHRVGGWLFSAEPAPAIAAHLAAHLVQMRLPGRPSLLRLQDPSVFDQAWPIFNPAQRNALLGPIRAWYQLQADGTRSVYGHQPQAGALHSGGVPPLDPQQWLRLDHIGPINRARAQLRTPVSADTIAAVAAAMLRAHGYGFHQADDLAAFAWRALSVSVWFDRHPRVQQLIRAGAADDSFGALTDDLTETDWSVIGMESNQETDA